MKQFLLPERLTIVPYFFRLVGMAVAMICFIAFLKVTPLDASLHYALFAGGFLTLFMVYLVTGILVPRLRDMGMTAWVAVVLSIFLAGPALIAGCLAPTGWCNGATRPSPPSLPGAPKGYDY